MPPPAPMPRETPVWAGAAAGILAGLLAVAIGAIVAAMLHRPSPVDAVGGAVIDHAPPEIKQWAIRNFGRHDKDVLRGGIAILLGAAAAGIGVGTLRRWVTAPIGVATFGALGVAASLSRYGSGASAAVPSIIAALVALAVLASLLVGVDATGADLARTDADPAIPEPGSDAWPVRSWPRRSLAGRRYDRRRFLGRSAATAGVVAVAAVAGSTKQRDTTREALASAPESLPAPVGPRLTVPAGASLNPATPYVTPAADFYRIDTALSYPRVRADHWKLRIHGMVDHPRTFTYDDLLARPQVERMVTLTCVSNDVGGDLIGNALWQGVLLRDLLAEAGPQRGAQQLATTSVDGFTAGFPLEVATDPTRDALVAIGMNGRPLPLPHGFPARLVVPGLYGYVSATKWLNDLRLTTWDDFDGYWVQEGWAKRGPIKTGSRIDVPRVGTDVPAGPVVVAGVAWAQHRGISKVEVQVDDGPWRVAELGGVIGTDTWRQWRLTWDATRGEHDLTVRATDGMGHTQTSQQADPAPDGASGWHRRTVRVSAA